MRGGSDYANIIVEGHDVVMITLNRPNIHNPFDDATIAELTDCFKGLKENKDVRCVVITGAGKSFCSGADLNWMKKMAQYPRDDNVTDATRLSDMFVALETLEVPTIARVNGAAFGGGAGLVCACDFAIACERATLSFSEVKLGLLPGVISPYVIDRIGIKNAVRVFSSGEKLDPVKALSIGLVDEVVSLEGLDKSVDDLIDLILTGGPEAVKECKKLARTYGRMSREEFRTYCIEAIADARASDEGKEGVVAFLEKRKPSWRQDDD